MVCWVGEGVLGFWIGFPGGFLVNELVKEKRGDEEVAVETEQ